MKLSHKLRAPSEKVDLVSGVHSTLLIGVKSADADYFTILDKEGINIYDKKKPKPSSQKRQCSVGTAQKKDSGAFL